VVEAAVFVGRLPQNRAHSIGVSVSATNAEITTEPAVARRTRGTGPGGARLERDRDKHGDEGDGDGDDGGRDFLHTPDGRLHRRHAGFDVPEDVLQHHDGIVHHHPTARTRASSVRMLML